MEEKIIALCALITKEKQEYLKAHNLGCEDNLLSVVTSHKAGKKYTRIDNCTSGMYMVDNATGEIYGIKAYGVIHRGHFYGTLDTINDYYWGDYTASKK
jgi:hypothetical protein